jgi:peptidylprolyl isomerase
MDEQAIQTASGLEYIEIVEGTGARPKTGDSVSVHYTGWLKSGQKFDSSRDRGQPFVFPIGRGRVIKGWDEGVSTMKVGGTRKLIIPAHLGYGDRGAGGVIPPGATLIFEVELMSIEPV